MRMKAFDRLQRQKRWFPLDHMVIGNLKTVLNDTSKLCDLCNRRYGNMPCRCVY